MLIIFFRKRLFVLPTYIGQFINKHRIIPFFFLLDIHCVFCLVFSVTLISASQVKERDNPLRSIYEQAFM